jgi:hypothetical protein
LELFSGDSHTGGCGTHLPQVPPPLFLNYTLLPFWERNEEGSAMDRRSTESHSIYWTYMTEREYNVVSTEDMLKKQILLMD